MRRPTADSGVTVGGLTDDTKVGRRIDQDPEARPHQRLVVDDDDGDHVMTASRGRLAMTANPPPGRNPALRVPPKSATRSRMPTMPW